MTTAAATVHHPIFARFFAKLCAAAETAGQSRNRDELLAGLAGDVIEVGAGTGLNFKHYPPQVERVLAVEPEAYLRAKALEAAPGAPVPVEVVPGDADALPAGDGDFDAGVFSLVLCSVPSQEHALAEMHRVIKPGGELRFYEHVLSDEERVRKLQRAIEPVWKRAGGNCHLTRDTAAAIERAGFQLTEWRKLEFKPNVFATPVSLHILGRARRV